MINLALRSEYSFKQTFGHMASITTGQKIAVGVADINSTYGHIKLHKACSEADIKPIYGVRIMVVEDARNKVKTFGPEYIFIAKTLNGLREIYRLVRTAHDNFYYFPRIDMGDVMELSNDVFVIASNFKTTDRLDYIALSPNTPRMIGDEDWGIPKVAINNNYFTNPWDRDVYELMAGRNSTSHTYPQHVLSDNEFMHIWGNREAIANTYIIADQCNVEIEHAPMVKYKGMLDMEIAIKRGARLKGIDLAAEPYKSRLERELELIKEKDFRDYFLVVADMIKKAKKTGMLVGPSRGSSAGSLVCYLLDITEIDPMEFDLIFERFIDINRHDLPDIDIDFPDSKREKVIKQLEADYGKDYVSHIANISTFKPKSAISEFAAGLGIPKYETDEVKDSIIERSGGDARAEMQILDTLNETSAGKILVEKYPNIRLVSQIEGHASHTSTHAAGIIVCNRPLTDYVGVDTRNNQIMVEKKGAESINLLKIDVLGLRTLSILEECAKLAGFDAQDLYKIPLDDEEAFDIFNTMRIAGIFQFEGQALQYITRQIGVHDFNDIVAITSLARPGAMNSGGTARFVKYKLGKEEPIYRNKVHQSITEDSLGIVIYQEQMMRMAKEIGNMSWEDVSTLRKAASKSLGDEFFSKFKDKFIKGAVEENGYDIEDAEALWHDISATGSWTFNKSHAVSYGLVSYWTAWCKAHYPMEFAVANLNHAKDDEQAVRFLRDMVKNEGTEYIALDPDESDVKWTVSNGKLLGPLTSIKGIGIQKARQIIRTRNEGGRYTPSIVDKLMNPDTPFVDIFPAYTKFKDLYDEGHIINISDINTQGTYTFAGRVILRDLRDRNDYQSVTKRGGKYVDKNQFYLKLIVEDDTDQIMAMISPQDFDKLHGKSLAEILVAGSTWIIIRGAWKADWRMINIEVIEVME